MRYFYIDTENMSKDSWMKHFKKLASTDTVYIIWTDHSPKLTYGDIEKCNICKGKIITVKAECGTSNAADFVLVAVLAEQCKTAIKSDHYIVSNDKGYAPVMEYYNRKGIVVKQISSIGLIINCNGM